MARGVVCYVCEWICECECDRPYELCSLRFIFDSNVLYHGNSQHRTNFNADGTSTYTDGGIGINGDVDSLYLRYSGLLQNQNEISII